MSVKELADEEAARAEAESPDEEEAETTEEEQDEPVEPTPEEPPAAVGPTSEADFEKLSKRLEAESTRHANRISEIMGEDAQGLRPCPLCWQPGFLPPEGMPWPDPEREVAVRVVLGEAPMPDYLYAEDKETCSECAGLTKTKTGALAGEQVALPCRKCNGQGWTAKLAAAVVSQPLAQHEASPPGGVADVWGRPAGHPHWGMAPATVGA